MLRVSGADAASFLQGQFSNDLRSLGRGQSVYGLWLTLKGKVLADSFIIRPVEGEGFLIVSYFCAAEVIKERLESYIIADDVEVTNLTPDFVGWSLMGGEQTAPAVPCGVISFRGRRVRGGNEEWLLTRAESARCVLPPAWTEVDAAAAEALRIADGIPAVPQDLGPTDLPNEAALEADTISYTKGCYLGQEVMARLKSMGQVRRRLLRVNVAGPGRPTERAPLYVGEKNIGELRSVAPDPAGNGFMGFAMLSLLGLGESRALALEAGGPSIVSVSGMS